MMKEVSLILTKKCNLNCPFCFVKNQNEEMSMDIFVEVKDQILQYIIKNKQFLRVNFYGGEPLLKHRWILRFVSEVSEILKDYGLNPSKFIQIAVYTSGTVNLDEFLDGIEKYRDLFYIQVSYNGKNSGFKNDINIIKKICQSKKGINVINTVIHKDNSNQIFDIFCELKDIDLCHRWDPRIDVTMSDYSIIYDDIINGYTKILDYIIKKKDHNLLFSSGLKRITKGGLYCGAGIDMVCVDTSGRLYGCTHSCFKNNDKYAEDRVYADIELVRLEDFTDSTYSIQPPEHVSPIDSCNASGGNCLNGSNKKLFNDLQKLINSKLLELKNVIK